MKKITDAELLYFVFHNSPNRVLEVFHSFLQSPEVPIDRLVLVQTIFSILKYLARLSWKPLSLKNNTGFDPGRRIEKHLEFDNE